MEGANALRDLRTSISEGFKRSPNPISDMTTLRNVKISLEMWYFPHTQTARQRTLQPISNICIHNSGPSGVMEIKGGFFKHGHTCTH